MERESVGTIRRIVLQIARGWRVCLVLAPIIACGLPSVAHAQSRDDMIRAMLARDGLPAHVVLRQDACRLHIASRDCERLISRLTLSPAQEKAVLSLHTQYEHAIDEAFKGSLDRLVKGSLGELIAELILPAAQAGKTVTDEVLDAFGRERAADLMRRIARDMKQAQDDAEDIRQKFERDLEAILSEEQNQRLPGALRALRREILLLPRNPRGVHLDLDLLPDVISLYAQAREPGEELGDLPATTPDEEREDSVLVDLHAILELYEHRLDAALLQSYQREWDLHIERFTAGIAGDQRAAVAAHERQLRAWQRLYRATDETVEAIATLIEAASGVKTREAWRARYHRVTFPELFATETPELMYQWLMDEIGDESIRSVADAVYESYLRARDPLRKEAKSLRLAMRLRAPGELPADRIVSLEHGVPDSMQEVELRRKTLAEETNQRLRAVLADEASRRRFEAHRQSLLSRSYGRVHEMIRY